MYLDDEKTGAKTYHVYFKQLGGGTLTLTTGKAGASNLTLNSGTYVAIIYVDQDGNVTSQGATATSTIASGSTQPATRGGVANAINYSNTEVKTGAKWIDGKDIYRIGVKVNANYGAGQEVTLMDLTNITYSAIIKIGCTIFNRNRYWTDGNETGRSKAFVDSYTKKFISANAGTTDYGASVFYAYLEYTK